MLDIIPIDFCNNTLQLKKTIESSFLVLGERLAKIRSERLWESNWDSWAEYLMEMKVTESTASRLISVYDKYVIEYKISEEKLANVGWSNLYEMIPLLKDKGSADEMIDKTSLMRKEDIREEIRSARHEAHEHEWTDLHLRICKKCGKKERVYSGDYETDS